jgi:acetylornithine/succinyldiaminopimelate/putrescine aminotransferase
MIRDDFRKYLCQTSGEPDGLEVASAQGCWITDAAGNRYLDWLAGISVCNVGHRHPAVVEAIRAQADKYLHVMVYGEYVLEPQVVYARALCELAPMSQPQVYFTSSGAEAIEGALKVARKHTKRKRFVAFEGSYHGDTIGALSVTGAAGMRSPFEPLLETGFLPFGWEESLAMIDERVAAVVMEPIQAEGGVRVPPAGFLKKLREKCDATGALLILDEVQTGLGRTGTMWACEREGVVPDLLVLAKALGGGMPLGAFIGSLPLMFILSMDPPLAHLTTFGGHPVSCAAGLAALKVLRDEDLVRNAREQGTIAMNIFLGLKRAGVIVDARGSGLLLGVELGSAERAEVVVRACRHSGLLLGTALHDPKTIRMTPPLNMTDDELVRGLDLFTAAITETK